MLCLKTAPEERIQVWRDYDQQGNKVQLLTAHCSHSSGKEENGNHLEEGESFTKLSVKDFCYSTPAEKYR